jgi:hypothetical protein
MLHSGKILMLALSFALALAGPASGQTISTELFAKQNLTADDQQQIETFARGQLDRLGNGDSAARRASRRALLAPLQSPAASATFRLAYSRLTVARLEQLSESEQVDVATSAMLILGWLATDDAADVLLRHLRAEAETSRYGAATGLRRTLLLSTSDQSTAPAATVWKAVRRLTAALPTEASPHVVRAMVSALIASPRETSGVELAEALNRRLEQPLDDAVVDQPNLHFLIDAYIAAAFDLRNELIQPDQTNLELLDASVELGARYLVWSVCLHEMEMEREIDVTSLAEAGEDLLLIAHLSRTGQRQPEVMSDIVTQDGWPGAREAVLSWVGVDGVLHKRPYDFVAGAFIKNTCLED